MRECQSSGEISKFSDCSRRLITLEHFQIDSFVCTILMNVYSTFVELLSFWYHYTSILINYDITLLKSKVIKINKHSTQTKHPHITSGLYRVSPILQSTSTTEGQSLANEF